MTDAQPPRDSLDLEKLALQIQARKKFTQIYFGALYVGLTVGIIANYAIGEMASDPIANRVYFSLFVTYAVLFPLAIPIVYIDARFIRRRSKILKASINDAQAQYYPQLVIPTSIFVFSLTGFLQAVVNSSYIPSPDAVAKLALSCLFLSFLWLGVLFRKLYLQNDKYGGAFLRGRVIDYALLILFWQAATIIETRNLLFPGASIIGLGIIIFIQGVLPSYWVSNPAFKTANYAKSLQRADFLLRFRPHNILFQSLRGIVLFYGGYPVEAETQWRNLLWNPHNVGGVLKFTLPNLGLSLVDQGRFAEALPFLESAVKAYPDYGLVYADVADYYMQQEIHLERALELLEIAQANMKKPGSKNSLANFNYSWVITTKAVALALTGNHDRANSEIDHALKNSPDRYPPGLAAVHLNAARVRQIQGNLDEARDHLNHAIQLDPNGRAGKAAAKLLKKIDEVV